jgi:hypothetical protein
MGDSGVGTWAQTKACNPEVRVPLQLIAQRDSLPMMLSNGINDLMPLKVIIILGLECLLSEGQTSKIIDSVTQDTRPVISSWLFAM